MTQSLQTRKVRLIGFKYLPMFTPVMSGKTGIQKQMFLPPGHVLIQLHMLSTGLLVRPCSASIGQSHVLRALSSS